MNMLTYLMNKMIIFIPGSTEAEESEGNSQDIKRYTDINRDIKILQRDVKIKHLETEQAQLKLDVKVTEKELLELEAKITAVNTEIHEKEREIKELDEETASLQTMLENMKKKGQK